MIFYGAPRVCCPAAANGAADTDNKIWDGRYKSIVDLEEHLHRNSTRIVKFFLHLSKEEQRKRFLARIDEPQKYWKFSMADIKERGYWKDYMHAYELCITATSTRTAPWYIVPADDKVNARLIVSQVILDTLRALRASYPKVDARRRCELRAVRRRPPAPRAALQRGGPQAQFSELMKPSLLDRPNIET